MDQPGFARRKAVRLSFDEDGTVATWRRRESLGKCATERERESEREERKGEENPRESVLKANLLMQRDRKK